MAILNSTHFTEFESLPVMCWIKGSQVNYVVQDFEQTLQQFDIEASKGCGDKTEKMERVRTNLMSFSTYPYQPELSRHALQVARLSCTYFFFFDIMPTFDNEHNNILYWSGYIGLLVFYNLFRNPGNRRFSETSPRDPSDSNVAWLW